MERSLKKDLAYAMTPIKILSWPVGTWPLQEYNVASFLRTGTSVFVLLLTVVILNVETYLDGSDAETNLDSAMIVFCTIMAVAKVMQFRVHRDDLVSNFESAVKDYNEAESEEIRAIMRRHAYMGRVAGASGILFSYFSATLVAAVSMLTADVEETTLKVNGTTAKNANYPMPSEYTLQVLHVPEKLFLLIFIVQYMMLLLVCNGNQGSDAVFFGITFHLCGQAEVLKLKFTKSVNEKENTAKRFDDLIARHQHLLKLCKQLNDTISSVLVIQLCSSSMFICTTGFQLILSLNANNFVMVAKTFIVVTTLLAQLFAYSYVGEYFKDQMEGIGYSAYSCRWYDLPEHLSKNIIFILMRCRDPVHLKAGDFFVVNLETYMSIVKTSMSYLSVLRVMITTETGLSRCRTSLQHSDAMRTSLKKDLAYAMTPLKILAWPMGTWPLQEYNVASDLRTIVTVLILLVTLAILNAEMYLDGKDAEKNLDCMGLVSCTILAIWKVTQFRIRRDDLVSNFQSAVKDYKGLDSEEKREIMRRHAYMGRMAGASVIFTAFFSATLIAIVPMVTSGKEEATLGGNATKAGNVNYPLHSEHTLQVLHVPEKLFLLIFILQYQMMLVIGNGNLGSDAVFFGITFHLCGQAEILKLEFTKIVNDNENTARRLDALTARHRHLLKLSKQLNDTISSILVVQLFSSCLLICTTGFQLIISLNANNAVMEAKTFLVVTTILAQLFAYSYVGDYLKEQMEGVGYSAYSCWWYDLPEHLSKDIVFILMRAQDPVNLKAGESFVVNMETYMSILKTSMSYLSVMRVMITT
ncbi:uncharacterized protein LOC143374193 [Andrena cerasifolii]|uniref:uncharacterized protein LOC143374193 n=1 Tax=Andrena cerasifolii TaxID=2819439 RepID=UPI004037A882